MTDKAKVDDNLTLSERLAKASIDLGKFTADKRNKEQGYSYISADAVLSRGGDALAKQGLAVLPSVTDVKVNAVERFDAAGKPKGWRYDAQVGFSMSILDGGTARDCLWVGAGSDYTTPDKAIYKAITSGHKYFLMKLLAIGAGNEDSEHDDEPPARVAPPARTNGAQTTHDKLIERYSALLPEAERLGITTEPIESMTDREMLQAGKDLAALIQAKSLEQLEAA